MGLTIHLLVVYGVISLMKLVSTHKPGHTLAINKVKSLHFMVCTIKDPKP